MKKGTFYYYTNRDGHTTVVLCTRDGHSKGDRRCFTGTCVASDVPLVEDERRVGDHSKIWSIESFKEYIPAPIRALSITIKLED